MTGCSASGFQQLRSEGEAPEHKGALRMIARAPNCGRLDDHSHRILRPAVTRRHLHFGTCLHCAPVRRSSPQAALAALFFPGAGGRVQRLREGPGRGTFTAPADGVAEELLGGSSLPDPFDITEVVPNSV